MKLLQDRLIRRRYPHTFVFAKHFVQNRAALLNSARQSRTGSNTITSPIVGIGTTNDPYNDLYKWKKIFFIPDFLKTDPFFSKNFQRVVIALKHYANIGKLITRASFQSGTNAVTSSADAVASVVLDEVASPPMQEKVPSPTPPDEREEVPSTYHKN
jgi:hypothetical protein